MSDLERVLARECVHGQGPGCLTCALTRYLALSVRRTLTELFPTEDDERRV